MRLIDADGLLENINALEHLSEEYADSFVNAAGNRFIELSWLEDYIENVPTVDSEPVIHAHWEKVASRYHRRLVQCSNCENFLDMAGVNDVNCGQVNAKYCPNCGAKMDS